MRAVTPDFVEAHGRAQAVDRGHHVVDAREERARAAQHGLARRHVRQQLARDPAEQAERVAAISPTSRGRSTSDKDFR